jgi:hypothetical protein
MDMPVGQLTPGYLADVLVVRADPTQDVSVLPAISPPRPVPAPVTSTVLPTKRCGIVVPPHLTAHPRKWFAWRPGGDDRPVENHGIWFPGRQPGNAVGYPPG